MTTSVSTQQAIRVLSDGGMSDRQIAKQLRLSRNTVAKYVRKEDFSLQQRANEHNAIVDPFAHIVVGWIEADQRMPRKQRHTAKRLWEGLVDERGFTGSYTSVSRWVKRYKLEHCQPGVSYSELTWGPGVAQADYGQAQAVIDATPTDGACDAYCDICS